MYHCYLLLPSSSAQPSPNHSFRLRHHSICRLVLSDDTSGEAGGEMANTGVEIADTLDETLPVQTALIIRIFAEIKQMTMKRKFLYIILTIFLSASCAQKQPAVYMLRPHEELPKEIAADKSFTKIFLAGTIDMGNSRDWQMEIYETFSGIDGRYILYNPRQENWDATRPGEMDYQVRWELDHLEDADMVIMYILGTSKSPISLLEMGLHAKSDKMHVICEKDFYRYDNVRITCEYYGVPLYDDLDSFLENLTISVKTTQAFRR